LIAEKAASAKVACAGYKVYTEAEKNTEEPSVRPGPMLSRLLLLALFTLSAVDAITLAPGPRTAAKKRPAALSVRVNSPSGAVAVRAKNSAVRFRSPALRRGVVVKTADTAPQDIVNNIKAFIMPMFSAPDYSAVYWYDPRIHVWGNTGVRGAIHAAFAPLATYVIDQLSYEGFDPRKAVHATIDPSASVLDLCCGTGFSSARGATGVDTSGEMLSVARLRRPDCTFVRGNAEKFGNTDSFDVVTVMFATHEAPAAGRRRILRNAARIARREVIVVDIDPNFTAQAGLPGIEPTTTWSVPTRALSALCPLQPLSPRGPIRRRDGSCARSPTWAPASCRASRMSSSTSATWTPTCTRASTSAPGCSSAIRSSTSTSSRGGSSAAWALSNGYPSLCERADAPAACVIAWTGGRSQAPMHHWPRWRSPTPPRSCTISPVQHCAPARTAHTARTIPFMPNPQHA
jgi:SAM-dependent methyltransferase